MVSCVYKGIATYRKTIGNGLYMRKVSDPLSGSKPNFTAANGEFPGEKGQRVGKRGVP